jgi:3-deoxy-D-manno-octulosonic-acid transferase
LTTLRERTALAAYAGLLRLITPLYLARLWWRGRAEPGYRLHMPARLGFGPVTAAPGQGPTVWLHAVSLGETRAAVPLVQALRAQWPDMRLLLTCGTATGWTAGEGLLQAGDVHAWMPWDTPGAVRRFLKRHRPTLAVLMETEVWPSMLQVCEAQGLPVVLANARLSDKSLRSGQRFAALMRPAARRIGLALAQTADDARRLQAMGVSLVQVCGNIKFDLQPAADLLQRGRTWSGADARPIVMAASTREGEESQLLQAWARPGRDVKQGPRLCLVPRHPQRFDEIHALVLSAGLSCSRRSLWPQGQPDAAAMSADVWLGDSMGEMPAYYAASRCALLGGSFAPLGGQNLIEAAACHCPVVMGPSTFNFEQAAQVCEAAGVAWRVADAAAAVSLVDRLMADPALADVGHRAAALVASHQGAAAKMALALRDLVII